MIMEFRTYRMQPGARAEFVDFFTNEAIPRMRQVGMNVIGQFSSVVDDDVFAYARSFESLEQRERQYRAFYESQDWLGWMIDIATGKEESFDAFVGDSDGGPTVPLDTVSGVHKALFTLVSAHGPVTAVTDRTLSVGGDAPATFTLSGAALVWHTPDGRGMGRATPITIANIVPGDRVMVLGAETADGSLARQIVKRP